MKHLDVFRFEYTKSLVAMLNPQGSLNPESFVTPVTSVLTPHEIMTSKWVVIATGKTEQEQRSFTIARRLTSPEVVFFYTGGEIPPYGKTCAIAEGWPLVMPDNTRLTTPIPEGDESIPAGTVDTLFQSMYAHRALGLAANQIGLKQRIFVMDEHYMPRTFINPVIEHSEGEIVAQEGCVSFPGEYVKIKRASRVVVNGVQLDGIWARVAQHEIDHLNGVTIRDYQ